MTGVVLSSTARPDILSGFKPGTWIDRFELVIEWRHRVGDWADPDHNPILGTKRVTVGWFKHYYGPGPDTGPVLQVASVTPPGWLRLAPGDVFAQAPGRDPDTGGWVLRWPAASTVMNRAIPAGEPVGTPALTWARSFGRVTETEWAEHWWNPDSENPYPEYVPVPRPDGRVY